MSVIELLNNEFNFCHKLGLIQGIFPCLAFFLLLFLPTVNEITSYTGVKLQPAVGASSIKSVLHLLNSEDQSGYSHLFFYIS